MSDMSKHPAGEKTLHAIGGTFFEAAVDWDAILAYPLLVKNKIGVMPHRECLVLEDAWRFVFLRTASSKSRRWLADAATS